LRTDPDIGRLLDLGTTFRDEIDSQHLFERVFQELDEDSSKMVNFTKFQQYFVSGRDHGVLSRDGIDRYLRFPAASAGRPIHQDSSFGNEGKYHGCCGRDKKRPSRGNHVHRKHEQAPNGADTSDPISSAADACAMPSPHTKLGYVAHRDCSDEHRSLPELLGEPRKSGEKSFHVNNLQYVNTQLQSEYNLQSLKQDMLVHMWSMHMLDADQDDDM
jgi:hypothetical protein